MKITYIHKSNEYRDEIMIPGLVTEDIKLVVRESFKTVQRTAHINQGYHYGLHATLIRVQSYMHDINTTRIN